MQRLAGGNSPRAKPLPLEVQRGGAFGPTHFLLLLAGGAIAPRGAALPTGSGFAGGASAPRFWLLFFEFNGGRTSGGVEGRWDYERTEWGANEVGANEMGGR